MSMSIPANPQFCRILHLNNVAFLFVSEIVSPELAPPSSKQELTWHAIDTIFLVSFSRDDFYNFIP